MVQTSEQRPECRRIPLTQAGSTSWEERISKTIASIDAYPMYFFSGGSDGRVQFWSDLATMVYTAHFTDSTSAVLLSTFCDFTPPIIASQPVSVTVPTGGTAVFSVDAAVLGGAKYAWQKLVRVGNQIIPQAVSDTARISGSHTPTLTITSVQADDGAAFGYACTITACGGSVTSNAATLTLLPFCYPNCDGSTGAPLLSAGDFVCFLGKFRAGDVYANCDGSTGAPLLTASDFVCFLASFRAGCP